MSLDKVNIKTKSDFQIDGKSTTQLVNGLKEVFLANAAVCKFYVNMLEGAEPTRYSEVMSTVISGVPTADTALRIAQEQMRLDVTHTSSLVKN